MNIVMMKIKDVIPYDNNPRKNDEAVDLVANSIKEFGFKNPIVVDKDKVIITGHTRLKASIKLGLKEVPVIIASDLTDEQAKAYRLADNKVSEKAEWDFGLLDIELNSLELDMSEFGFELHDIDWEGVDDLDDDNYDTPEKERLECPSCGHTDSKIHFKKVE